MIMIVWILILIIVIGLYFDWQRKKDIEKYEGEEALPEAGIKERGYAQKKYIRNCKIIAVCFFIVVGTCVVGILN